MAVKLAVGNNKLIVKTFRYCDLWTGLLVTESHSAAETVIDIRN